MLGFLKSKKKAQLNIDKSLLSTDMRYTVIDTEFTGLREKVPTCTCFSSSPHDSSLYEIVKCFSIAVRGAHNALVDAFITAQVLQRFMPVPIDIGVNHISDLLEIGHPSEGGDKQKV